jgi:adenylate cyclase
MAVALMHRNSRTERERGLALLGQVRGMCVQGRYFLSEIPMVDVYTEWERARRGDHDAALPLLRGAVDDLFLAGQLGFCIVASAVLVGTLLDRGADGDVADAEAAIERLAVAPADDGLVIRDIWLLRLRTLLSRARGDETGYRDHRDRYRAMATSLGFEGHIAWAEAMP